MTTARRSITPCGSFTHRYWRGPERVATLIERDNQVPAFSVLQAEARQAEWYLSQVAR